jgi:hypothetical protein
VRITIVKGTGRSHRAVAVRDGGGAVQFPVADYGDRLPHDLVHYLVESELGLEWGFWGLLAAGADLDTVARYGARHRRELPHRPDPLVEEHADELLQAEELVAEAYPLSDEPGGDERRGTVGPGTGEPGLRARIEEWNVTWQGLAPGQRLRFEWPPAPR